VIIIRITHWCAGRALGFPDSPDGLPSSVVDGAIDGTRKIHARPDSTHVPSMLLDAQKGLPIEVEVILGEVVRMAKAHNVPLPVGLRGCFCCSAELMFFP
jgi:2-dehydropantoate 2-reductase